MIHVCLELWAFSWILQEANKKEKRMSTSIFPNQAPLGLIKKME